MKNRDRWSVTEKFPVSGVRVLGDQDWKDGLMEDWKEGELLES